MAEVVKKLRTEDGELVTKTVDFGLSDTSETKAETSNCDHKGMLKAESKDKLETLQAQETVEMLTEQEVASHLRETDVGITEYISSHEGFSGVIKQRFSDFLVNEIDTEGHVVHLTDTSLPPSDEEPTQDTKLNEELLTSVFTQEQLDQLQKMIKEKDHKTQVAIDAGEDKAKRSQIHEAIRESFPVLESRTEPGKGGSDSKVIKVTLPDRKHCKDKRMIRKPWPKGRGEYCHFVLYKENKDTIEAVNLLSKLMKMRPGSFQYAGTKDRRAKTSQMISIHKIEASRLQHLNRALRGMKLGNYKYCSNALKLGDHSGNRFSIILRNVTGKLEQIEQAIKSLKTVGFINYYGMQRFGTTTVPTHHIGRAILRSQWEAAIDLIMQPRDGDHPSVSEARSIWHKTKNAQSALEKLGTRVCIEAQLLQGLAKSAETDKVNALSNIPRNTRHLYLHAYQSYIWNKVASNRIKKFGLKPIVGDLVLPKCAQGSQSADAKVPVVVTTDNLPSYQITDVVLPLPGHDVKLPDNQNLQCMYTDLLAADNLTWDSFKHKVRDYSLSGDYRHIIVRPEDVSHEVLCYDDVTKSLVLSDLDRFEGQTEVSSQAEGKFVALKVEFSLPSSTYATMAIREILKQDTSAAHQTTLNVT